MLRLCHKLRIDMAHFCTDLQTYIAFEVLQVGLLLPAVGPCCCAEPRAASSQCTHSFMCTGEWGDRVREPPRRSAPSRKQRLLASLCRQLMLPLSALQSVVRPAGSRNLTALHHALGVCHCGCRPAGTPSWWIWTRCLTWMASSRPTRGVPLSPEG